MTPKARNFIHIKIVNGRQVSFGILTAPDGTEFKIDRGDFFRCKFYRWRNNRGYAYNSRVGYLHRFILCAPGDLEVDHINGNRRDNRRCNLRLATRQENIQYREARRAGNPA